MNNIVLCGAIDSRDVRFRVPRNTDYHHILRYIWNVVSRIPTIWVCCICFDENHKDVMNIDMDINVPSTSIEIEFRIPFIFKNYKSFINHMPMHYCQKRKHDDCSNDHVNKKIKL